MERLTLLMDLKKLRIEADVSLETVESLSGVPMRTYRTVEAGATPSLETALKIARALQLPVEEIWGMQEEAVESEQSAEHGSTAQESAQEIN